MLYPDEMEDAGLHVVHVICRADCAPDCVDPEYLAAAEMCLAQGPQWLKDLPAERRAQLRTLVAQVMVAQCEATLGYDKEGPDEGAFDDAAYRRARSVLTAAGVPFEMDEFWTTVQGKTPYDIEDQDDAA
jgi:hypothetical protein